MSELIKRCAWCRRIEIDGKWVHMTAPEELISDGMCEECYEKTGKENGEEK